MNPCGQRQMQVECMLLMPSSGWEEQIANCCKDFFYFFFWEAFFLSSVSKMKPCCVSFDLIFLNHAEPTGVWSAFIVSHHTSSESTEAQFGFTSVFKQIREENFNFDVLNNIDVCSYYFRQFPEENDTSRARIGWVFGCCFVCICVGSLLLLSCKAEVI